VSSKIKYEKKSDFGGILLPKVIGEKRKIARFL
jgi:hypothetical protein